MNQRAPQKVKIQAVLKTFATLSPMAVFFLGGGGGAQLAFSSKVWEKRENVLKDRIPTFLLKDIRHRLACRNILVYLHVDGRGVSI
jgi:hypothetical protein